MTSKYDAPRFNGCKCHHTALFSPCEHGCHDLPVKVPQDETLELVFDLLEELANEGVLPIFESTPARGTGFDGLDEVVDEYMLQVAAEAWDRGDE